MTAITHAISAALLHDLCELVVVRHFPGDDGAYARHATLGLLGTRCEPRPQHHRVRLREAGGDAERERICREARLGRAARERFQ